jgi:hypothetical protein
MGELTGAAYDAERPGVGREPTSARRGMHPSCCDGVSAHVDHYAAPDVPADASAEEIRASWRLRVVAFHPDRFRDEDQRRRAEELSQRANAAWLVLGDPVKRARYDRARRDGPPEEPAGPVRRRVPCPSCAARCSADDSGGIVVALTCPACGQAFSAMLGARVVGRPQLQRKWMTLTHEMVVATAAGELDVVRFRRLPQELALAEGELLSVVFHPTSGRPVYAIAHDPHLDLGWRVG